MEIFTTIVAWAKEILPHAIKGFKKNKEKDKDKKEEYARYHFSNDPSSKFSRKKIDLTTETINSKLKNEINKKEYGQQEKIEVIEKTFLPFSTPYIPITFKKIKKTIDPYGNFFNNIDYREEFSAILKSSKSSIDLNGKKVKDIFSEEDIYKLINQSLQKISTESKENMAIILSGNIGLGKTAFFSKLMYDIATSNTPDLPVYRLAVDINFEDILNTNSRHGVEIENVVDGVIVDIQNKIKSIKDKMKSNKNRKNIQYRLVLFFDNLDILHQQFCEDYFISPTGHKFVDIFYKITEKILNGSLDKTPLILVCGLRGESINALNDRKYGDTEYNNKFYSLHFEIANKNAEDIKNIIKKRLKFASYLAQNEKFTKEIKKTVKNNYETFFDNTEIDFEEINNISSEGLRNTVDLFYRVTPSIFDEKVFYRFFIDKYYIKKLHFLGDSTAYTQARNGIFNLFLNNAQYRRAERDTSNKLSTLCKVSNDRLMELADIDHVQTYWLKYFILVYLYSSKQATNIQPIDINELVRLFSPKGTVCKYEENIVRLVLLGLSESRHGKILDIVLSKNGRELNTFELSTRGEYILENIVWSFDYLAIIVEDYWLQFPEELSNKFEWFFEPEISYCYLIDEESFKKNRILSLSKKIKKIKLFLEVLEISYDIEKEKIGGLYKDIEHKAKALKGKGFSLPFFSDIKEKVFATAKGYAKECGLSLKGDMSLYTDILNKQEKNKYKEFFRIAYGLNNEAKDERKVYYQENEKKVDRIIEFHKKTQPVNLAKALPGLEV